MDRLRVLAQPVVLVAATRREERKVFRRDLEAPEWRDRNGAGELRHTCGMTAVHSRRLLDERLGRQEVHVAASLRLML